MILSLDFILTVYSPRFSTGYFPQRNRFTVLVETHSWKDFARRVQVTRNTIIGLAELMSAHGARWLEQAQRADEAAARLAGKAMTLDFASGWREPSRAGKTADRVTADVAPLIEFRGYAYTRSISAISGERVTAYDANTPQIWRVPYRNQVHPSVVVTAPRGGYLVPAGYAQEMVARLELHGIHFIRLERQTTAANVQVFRARAVRFSDAPFEGRMRATIEGQWSAEARDVPAGTVFVPIGQRLARLVMALLEPQAPDSFAAWGFFNACFEQKEQLEPYVAELIAREMMERDAGLAREFNEKLATDSAFAADPAARLEFFLRRHASWDEQLGLYPVYRSDGEMN